MMAYVKGLKIGNVDAMGDKGVCDAVRAAPIEPRVAQADQPTEQANVKARPASEVVWSLLNGSYQTAFDGIVESAELGDALEQWGYERMLESDDAHFEIVGSWPGMPHELIRDPVEVYLWTRQFP